MNKNNKGKLYQHGARISFFGRMPFYYFIALFFAIFLCGSVISPVPVIPFFVRVIGIYISSACIIAIINPFLTNNVYMYVKNGVASISECKSGGPAIKIINIKDFSKISFIYRTQASLTFDGVGIDGKKLEFCVQGGAPFGLWDFLKLSKFFEFIMGCKETKNILDIKQELVTSGRGKFCRIISGNFEPKRNDEKSYLFDITAVKSNGALQHIKNAIALPDIIDHVETAKSLCIGNNRFGTWIIYGVISASGDIIVDLSDFTLSKSSKRQILYNMMMVKKIIFIPLIFPIIGVFYFIYCTAKYSVRQADYFVIYDLLREFQKTTT